jgi:SAM-dependent methyltransferase
MAEAFDQAAYWKERHRKLRGDHRATGNISRPADQMLQRKIIQAYYFSALLRTLRAEAGDRLPSEVLDIGFGTGFLGSLLVPSGFDYTGYDLSEVAVEDSSAVCPEARYLVRNIVREAAQPSDFIIASEVLFHIVDDAEWSAAIGNIAAGMRPAGIFLFTETFVAELKPGPPHFKARTRAMYEAALAVHGLRFIRPEELRLAAMPVFNQYASFKGSMHFVRLAE